MNELETALSIANEAGACVLDFFRRGMAVSAKGEFDIVTEADRQSAAVISARLHAAFPDDAIVCEESGETEGSSGRCWYVDPLDGTKNFAHGFAHFCTMLALEQDGALKVAVVHDAARGETFTAERGRGAWCNGVPIRVSQPAALGTALVVSGFPSSKRHAEMDPAPFFRVARAVQGLRRTGCTGLDLAYTARGRFDALWEWGLESWDIAAGILLLEEAGGICSDWSGAPYRIGTRGLVAGSPPVHAQLLECISGKKDFDR